MKLRHNFRWRSLFAGSSDKYKTKSFLVSELNQLISDLWHPRIPKKALIDLKNHILSLHEDGDEKFKPLTTKQKDDYFIMRFKEWKEKYPNV